MNKLRIWKAIARGVLLEAVRRKDLWVIAILGMIIILAASMLGFFGVRGLEVFVKDLAVTVLGMFSTIVAILTSSRLLPDEIRNRTLYPLLARPITRLDLLLGKFFGAVAATWIGFLCLASLTAVALAIFHVQFEWVMLQYLVLKMMGLVVLCAVTLTLSAYMTPQAAATMSFVLAFGSVMFVRGLEMASHSSTGNMKSVFLVANDLLPQYLLFDEGARAANIGWGSAPVWVVLALMTYMIVYSGAVLLMAWSRFKKQAV
jgi:ABC-type transport system involved in multi-copper enzyme maturation permease subunit